jgi:hypothetical protein
LYTYGTFPYSPPFILLLLLLLLLLIGKVYKVSPMTVKRRFSSGHLLYTMDTLATMRQISATLAQCYAIHCK